MKLYALRFSFLIAALVALACVPHQIVQSANLIFEDNFNTNTLDTTKWTIGFHDPDTGDVVPGAQDQFLLNNNYAGYITEEDVQQHSGALHLLNQERRYRGDNRVWYDYTSGQVMSMHKFHFNKGYIEWKAKFPTGDSMWPALWLIAEDLVWGPEWDAFEYFGTRNSIGAQDVMGMHLATGEWPNINWNSHWEYNFDTTYDNEAWHVYGFEWTATEANWFVDGKLMHSLPNRLGPAWPNEEMYIVMNNGILSSETPADPADFPNSLTIDYVRVWDSIPNSADFNFDETVDGLDYLAWTRNFGNQGASANFPNGDANRDGGIDGSDLVIWQSQFGGPPLVANLQSVPEPSAITLFLCGIFLLGLRRT